MKDKKRFYPAVYSTVAAALVLAFVVSVYNAGKNNTAPEQLNADENTGAAAVAKNDVKSYREISTEAATQPTNVTEKAAEATTAAKSRPAPQAQAAAPADEPHYTLFDDTREMSWPVEGRIVMDYSVDTAVYDKTLDQYRTNSSLCISAAADTEVVAAADGIVEAVSYDKVNGNSVMINHGNGWKTTYSQLREDVNVTEGEVVCEGDIIGRIGAPSAYSEALGTHLDFTVSRDEASVDPKTVLKTLDE